MKFFGKIAALFCIFVIAAYSLPIILNPVEQLRPQTDFPNPDRSPSDSDKGYPLPVIGYEFYIGQPIESYIEKHGEPVRKGAAYGGGEWWTFGSTAQDYIQIGIKDGIIQSLFILGDRIDAGMFTIGMNRDNILDEGYLAKKFHLSIRNQDYKLELSEEQQWATPLIQFENDSFLVLLFDIQTQSVYGLQFLSNEALMNLEYYPVISDDEYKVEKHEWLREELIDAENTVQIKTIFSILRMRQGLEPVQDNLELQAIVDQILPQTEEINDFTAKFSLTEQRISNEISELAPDKEIPFLFKQPFYDIPNLVVEMMQDEEIYALIQNDRLKNIAVASNLQYHLVVFGEQWE